MISPWFRHFGAHSKSLAGVLLVTCAFVQASGAASAAFQCRSLFTGSGVGLEKADQIRYSGRMTTIEWKLGQQFRNAVDPSKVSIDPTLVQESLAIAKIQLEARGAKTTAIKYRGQPALEILPGNDQWGRIAKTIGKIHQTKLIFAPVALAEDYAVATYERKSEKGRVINVSFESLTLGPTEDREVQHELGHMDEETRGLTPFSGHILTLVNDKPIMKGNQGYTVEMMHDEVPRNLRDFFMRGLDLSRNDTPLNRQRLQEAAIRSREVVLNMSASLSLTNKLRARLEDGTNFSVGPVMRSDGEIWQQAAHLTGGGLKVLISKTMVLVHGKEEPAVSLQVQSDHKAAVVLLPWNDGWQTRFDGLVETEDNAVDETIDYLIEHLEKREAAHRPVITTTLASARFITRNPEADAKTLATEAMDTRRVIAPLLVRPPRER